MAGLATFSAIPARLFQRGKLAGRQRQWVRRDAGGQGGRSAQDFHQSSAQDFQRTRLPFGLARAGTLRLTSKSPDSKKYRQWASETPSTASTRGACQILSAFHRAFHKFVGLYYMYTDSLVFRRCLTSLHHGKRVSTSLSSRALALARLHRAQGLSHSTAYVSPRQSAAM